MAINKVTTDVIDMSGNTGGLVWAKGATGDQPLPVDSTAGDLRENTTTGKTEVFNGTEWKNLKEATPLPLTVDYLVVAGGGGGGNVENERAGGGGGAGGFLTSYGQNVPSGGSVGDSLELDLSTDYTVTVGPGGIGNANGSNSVFSTLTANGGGAGGGSSDNGSDGGSGGGGGGHTSIYSGGSATNTGQQGNDGGTSAYGGSSTSRVAAGGGGAGAAGTDATTAIGGNGGIGISVNITGSSTFYAGGGGGGNHTGTAGTGGTGGGGNGVGGNGNGGNGTANTGGGAGGSCATSGQSNTGGTGGSGVVIIRYPDTYSINVGAGLITGVLNQAVGVGEKYTTFTAGTGTITFS